MTEATAVLFDEFATAYRRGEAPDVFAYLERAGVDADALAELIDRFLQAVPARASTEEEIVLMQARLEQEPPLLFLRIRRKLSRGVVVDTLLRTLGLDPAKREKVDGYYHQLETGLLDPEPVDRTVWEALSDLLRANTRALAVMTPTPPAAAAAYRRFDAEFVLEQRAVPSAAPDDGQDEIDRLFTGVA